MEEGLNYFLSQNSFELKAICFVKDVLYAPKLLFGIYQNDSFLKPAHCCVVPYQKQNQDSD